MWNNFSSFRARDAVIDRLLGWHDQAKLAGRASRAEALLALAWFAFERPQVIGPLAPPRFISSSILRAFSALVEPSIDADALV
jgi:hypothetical protein